MYVCICSCYSLKVNDIHEKHDDLDDGEDDHGQRWGADRHLFLVRAIGLIALKWLRWWHHIPAVSGQQVAYHQLVMQRHRIELIKVQMAIVIDVALAQYLLGYIGRYVATVAIRYETL